jgi:hypothetical protein
MRRATLCFTLILVGTLLAPAAKAQGRFSQERANLALAEQASLRARVKAHSEQARRACEERPVTCIGPDQAELALIASNSSSALASLAGLLQYRVDAGLSQGLDCNVVSKGPAIRKHLNTINPKALVARCARDVNRTKADYPGLFDDVTAGAVCATPADLEQSRQELKSAIAHGRKCPV